MAVLVSRYTKALYSFFSESNNSRIEDDIKKLQVFISTNTKIKILFNGPKAVQNSLINALSSAVKNRIITNLCKILAKNKRLCLLPNIMNKFLQMAKKERNEVDIFVTSAVPLSKKQQNAIISAINIDKKVNLISHIDKSILGGIIVRKDYNVLDLSLKHRLEMLKLVSKGLKWK